MPTSSIEGRVAAVEWLLVRVMVQMIVSDLAPPSALARLHAAVSETMRKVVDEAMTDARATGKVDPANQAIEFGIHVMALFQRATQLTGDTFVSEKLAKDAPQGSA